MKFRISTIITLLFILITSCNDIKFDKNKWNEKDDMEYDYRKDMLNDLTTNYKLTGIKYSELTRLLGKPDFVDSNSLIYEIVVKYDMIDPDYTKDLYFTLSKDSIITAFEVKEWRRHH